VHVAQGKTQKVSIQMGKGLHVINERSLQMTKKFSMQGGAFKYKEKKTFGIFYIHKIML
jgi:hypothetical protein